MTIFHSCETIEVYEDVSTFLDGKGLNMVQLSLFAYILIFTILLTLFLIIVASKNLQGRASHFFLSLLLTMLIWQTGYLIELCYISDWVIATVSKLEYFGIAFVPMLWFFFVWSFLEKKISIVFFIISFVIPILTLYFVLFPGFNTLMWTHKEIEVHNGLKFIVSEYGIWFWIQSFYAYALMFAGTVLLFRAFLKRSGTERTRILFLLMGAFIPWVANILTLFGGGIFKYIDFTPIAFVGTVAVSSVDIYAFFLLRLRDVAQDLVYRNLKDLVLILDAEDVIVEMNPFAMQFFAGMGVQNLRGQKMEILFSVFHFEVEVNREDEVVFVFRSGKKKLFFEISVARLNPNKRKSLGTLLTLHNISDRIQTEQRLSLEMQKNKEQEKMLIQQDRLASMGQMLGAIAHQWRQPLNALGLMVQDIKDAYEYGELDQAYLNDNVNRAMEQISFLSNTIDDFRNFFKRDKEKECFELPEVIRAILKILSIQLQKHSIRIEVEYRKNLGEELSSIESALVGVEERTTCQNCSFEIESIPNEVKQVLLNLINNAKDAILEKREKNGKFFEGVIQIRVLKVNPFFSVQIRDNGCGIRVEDFDKIFDPYFSTKEEGKGTGIGLYMSRMIVENSLGGKLLAETNQRGAIFTLFLPQ